MLGTRLGKLSVCIVCFACLAVGSFARIYFRFHTPLDVGVSVGLGTMLFVTSLALFQVASPRYRPYVGGLIDYLTADALVLMTTFLVISGNKRFWITTLVILGLAATAIYSISPDGIAPVRGKKKSKHAKSQGAPAIAG